MVINDEYTLFINSLSDSEAFLGLNKDRSATPYTIIGVPLDISTSYRSGSALAPKAVRRASKSLELCSAINSIDVTSIGANDLGDISIIPGNLIETLSRIEYVMNSIFKEMNRRNILLGGEHTLTLATFRAYTKNYVKPCLIVLDAHTDLRDDYLGSKYNHATVVRRIHDETKSMIVIIGARAVSREEEEFYRSIDGEKNMEIFRIIGDAVDSKLMNDIEGAVSACKAKYISIDIDVLDPSYAPGVQTPEPLGMSPHTLLNILYRIIGTNTYAVDIVEMTPVYDPSEITAFVVAKIIVELIAMMSEVIGLKVMRCW
ncbi:MAG: agmatinase [Ignisphaera sp.]|nr:agmatinase [Ignisphaera sp.]MCX8168084.1 agmatinase [Ignisphaera sp.]MDW8085908.1 agmatinase [Ignisphaera sp.]